MSEVSVFEVVVDFVDEAEALVLPPQLSPLLLISTTMCSGGEGLSIHPQSWSSVQSSRYPAKEIEVKPSERSMKRVSCFILRL